MPLTVTSGPVIAVEEQKAPLSLSDDDDDDNRICNFCQLVATAMACAKEFTLDTVDRTMTCCCQAQPLDEAMARMEERVAPTPCGEVFWAPVLGDQDTVDGSNYDDDISILEKTEYSTRSPVARVQSRVSKEEVTEEGKNEKTDEGINAPFDNAKGKKVDELAKLRKNLHFPKHIKLTPDLTVDYLSVQNNMFFQEEKKEEIFDAMSTQTERVKNTNRAVTKNEIPAEMMMLGKLSQTIFK